MKTSDKKQLLRIARNSIGYGIHHGSDLIINIEKFSEQLTGIAATFVTLFKMGELRGCVGCLEASRPLITDVSKNAFQSAFHDIRFSPVTQKELNKLIIKISILSPAETIKFSSEKDLISQICPNIDGLILRDGFNRGTFLPNVWETIPEPQSFVHHLKKKAGLSSEYWSDTIKIDRYTTFEFGEDDV